ncbi:hypothetical protein M3610_09170 [Neobacillus sp. MER 74]|uniref:hypothetical protein n=1 Tax=Neobacillus sp. MER 74 TaxID=2939566 RepID=UPI00203AF40B|nr:hypothetical protein [Neobacillus sp. MER 74]MCM3115457.1 hypothetical protein [Neobacillus sp. MER 74]
MKQVQLINVKTNEVQAFPIRKSVADYIESLNITDNSVKTIEAKVAKAIKNDEVLYETFKVVEITDLTETDIEINIEQPNMINLENLQTALAETFENTQTEDIEPKIEEEEKPTEEKVNKRRNGKQVEWWVNGELKQTFPSIKACATYFKETLELKGMPFTPIMKSIRDNVNWNENTFKFAE